MRRAAGPVRRVPDAYLKLIRSFPLRPIRTEDENEEALGVVAALAGREPLAPEERDYLDVLVDLVRKFEADQYPAAPVNGRAMVRHLIDARNLTQAEVAAGTGIAESALSEILAGKRSMGTRHVKALARFFGVSTDTILGD
jgi:HTH-type transcriptional regulator/antitoxin HigA